jgi:hypothetical protein
VGPKHYKKAGVRPQLGYARSTGPSKRPAPRYGVGRFLIGYKGERRRACRLTAPCGASMTGSERPLKDKLAFQIVRLKIQQIFEECSKFDESDKKALYEVMGNLLLQRIGAAEPPTPANETPPGLTELTDAAPTDDSTKSSTLPMVDVNAAFPT